MDATNYSIDPTIPAPRRRLRRRRWIATSAAVVALAVAGAAAGTLPPGGPIWQPWSSAIAQTEPQVTAIQQVIQRSNDEQTQALATGNPSLMSDTATASHYQELVKVNQDLVSSGVTGISLAKLEWGPISVNGATATATTYETWTTTASDGTTTQSRDTNLYTVVQNGSAWTIQADVQPGQQPTTGQQPGTQAPQPATTPPGTTPPALRPSGQNTSHNWSGYAATSGGSTYTGVSGTWTVPQPKADGTPGVGATWVGIGGVNSRDLIQAGTQDMAVGPGHTQYQAWIETLPQASHQVPLAVNPGDSVSVSIDKQASGTNLWQISFTNNTTGQTYQTSVQYASSLSSAEWVEEAPSGQSGILPLDDFGTIAFTGATATQAGQTVDLAQAGAQPISLLGASGQPLAVPSAISADGSSFSVARTQAPAVATPGRTPRISPYGVVPVLPFN